MSDLGVCIETYSDDDMGALPRWISSEERGEALDFRSFGNASDIWVHHRGEKYQLLHLANWFATKEGFVPTAVYQPLGGGIVYSRPYSEFIERFTPVNDEQQLTEAGVPQTSEQHCDILDSENAPVEVNQ